MSEDLRHRLDRLESLVERQAERIDDQQETIARQRERIGKLEDGRAPGDGDAVLPSTTRRTALKAGGLLALLGVGAGTAAADPQGQVGTGDDPIETLRAAAIEGPLTDGVRLDSLVGEGLAVRDGKLTNAIDVPALSVSDVEIPSLHDEMSFAVDVEVDETAGVQTAGLSATVEFSDGEQVAQRTVEPPEIQGDTATVTVGDGSAVGPLDAGEYTATVTVDATNAEPATAIETFTVETQFAGGDGTSENPYEIATWHHLDRVRNELGDEFVLIADLDPTTDGYDAVGSETANGDNGFDPIGDDGNEFTGTFDGDGHTITGLTIERSGDDGVGLFGVTDSRATIENVGLEAVDISGDSSVGGLVGFNAGGTVSTSYATGSVSGNQYVGGLVGYNEGPVSTSYATGSVSGDSDVGGLIGYNEGPVSTSYATGSVNGTDLRVGGLIGYNFTGTVERTYATGSVSGTEDVGGLIGYKSSGDVSSSYWDVPATDQGDSAGDDVTGIGSTSDDPPADGMVGDDLNDSLENEFDFQNVWEKVAEADTDAPAYPVLQALDRATQLEARV